MVFWQDQSYMHKIRHCCIPWTSFSGIRGIVWAFHCTFCSSLKGMVCASFSAGSWEDPGGSHVPEIFEVVFPGGLGLSPLSRWWLYRGQACGWPLTMTEQPITPGGRGGEQNAFLTWIWSDRLRFVCFAEWEEYDGYRLYTHLIQTCRWYISFIEIQSCQPFF